MTTLTLEQLIKITPFKEKTKEKALNKLPQMTPTERFKFERICWETLVNVYRSRIRFQMQEEIYKTAKEGRKEKIDLDRIEDNIIKELLEKIDDVKTEEELASIKQQLKQNISTQQTKAQSKDSSLLR